MMDQSTFHPKKFSTQSKEALQNQNLQQALHIMKQGFVKKRKEALESFALFEKVKEKAITMKKHTLLNLDFYLEYFEKQAQKQGTIVHWCKDSEQARACIYEIAKKNNAKTIAKGKSMVSEEIELNVFLEKKGFKVIETDLGEYIIQLRKERPSHLIAPALHVLKEEVKDIFLKKHIYLDQERPLETGQDLVQEARKVLRKKYFEADIGITGANFLVAETGSSLIVTNEGNGDLVQNIPKIHIAITGIEKVVPKLTDVQLLLRLLARSATGQDYTTYTSFATGAKRKDDVDGPKEHHVIILDNGRSAMLKDELIEMLRCIRCGACMNNCPVYGAIGGHAYGWVYPGPMGSVLTPHFLGIEHTKKLPHASTLCGTCQSVCPMNIPLPDLLRKHRTKDFQESTPVSVNKFFLFLFHIIALRPRLYRFFFMLCISAMRVLPHRKNTKNMLSSFILFHHWTKTRDFPKPQSTNTFIAQYKKKHHVKS